jgi:hypothetical protein
VVLSVQSCHAQKDCDALAEVSPSRLAQALGYRVIPADMRSYGLHPLAAQPTWILLLYVPPWSDRLSRPMTEPRFPARVQRRSASYWPAPGQRITSGAPSKTSDMPHLPVVSGEHNPGCPEDPKELRNIRNALQRQADQADLGFSLTSRALAAVHSVDQLLTLAPNELTVVTLSQDEFEFAARLQSRRPGGPGVAALSRRPGRGGSTLASRHQSPFAARRSLAFASDDEDALTLWNVLT